MRCALNGHEQWLVGSRQAYRRTYTRAPAHARTLVDLAGHDHGEDGEAGSLDGGVGGEALEHRGLGEERGDGQAARHHGPQKAAALDEVPPVGPFGFTLWVGTGETLRLVLREPTPTTTHAQVAPRLRRVHRHGRRRPIGGDRGAQEAELPGDEALEGDGDGLAQLGGGEADLEGEVVGGGPDHLRAWGGVVCVCMYVSIRVWVRVVGAICPSLSSPASTAQHA